MPVDDATTSGLRAVAAFDTRHVIATGSDGVTMSSDDGGGTWRPRAAATDDWIESIAVVDARTAFVVGARGTLLVTEDAGASWRTRDTPAAEKFHVVASLDRSRAVLGASDGRVFATDAAGATWTLVSASSGRAWIGAARGPAPRGEIWLCGEGGRLLRLRPR